MVTLFRRDDTMPGRPRRLTFLSLAAAFLVAAGCGGSDAPTGSDPSEPEILSFQAIHGDWEGVGQNPSGQGPTFWIELSVTEENATEGERIGTLDEFDSQGGDPLCLLDMFARTSEAPIFTVTLAYTFRTDRCGDAQGGVLRLPHDEEAETLTYEWKCPTCDNFAKVSTLTRVSN